MENTQSYNLLSYFVSIKLWEIFGGSGFAEAATTAATQTTVMTTITAITISKTMTILDPEVP